MSNHLPFATLTELQTALQTEATSSAELLETLLGRIEQYDTQINAVVAKDIAGAKARAQAADDARGRGENWGPLHGIPITIKDSYEVTGMPTTSGAPLLQAHYAAQNADAVQKLVDAGAIVFGKTNLPIFAGDWQSYNDVYGTTNNPWDLTRTPGGSSGGAAAALAAGFTPLELGSDIGGSIRTPAHYCGVYGHKPTHGIVSLRGHIPGPPGTLGDSDLSVAGPMARSAEDLALALQILAGPRPLEAAGWQLHLPQPSKQSLREYRVLAWLDDPMCPIDSGMRATYGKMVEALRAAGASVDEGKPAGLDFEKAYLTYLRLLAPIVGAGLPPQVLENIRAQVAGGLNGVPTLMAQYFKAIVQEHGTWLRAHEKREKLRYQMAAVFDQYDVLLTPITPWTALKHDHSPDQLMRMTAVNGQPRPHLDHLPWISLATALKLPATSAPVGQSEGLPVNVQIIGVAYHDYTTIDFAAKLASVMGGFTPPPDFAE